MTSLWVVCGVLLIGMVAPKAVNAASQRAMDACVGCDLRFSAEVTPTASRVTASGGGGVVLDKRVDGDGLTVTISAAGDTLRIVAGVDGTVTATRLGKVVTVRPETAVADYQGQVRELLAGSAALHGIERMVHAVRENNRAQALSVLATFALLRALQGDDTGNALLAQHMPQRRGYGIVRIGGQHTRDGSTVSDCWDEYERALDRNSRRYEQCLRDYWWAQPVQYACGLEFAMVAELSLFSLISCSGGFPI